MITTAKHENSHVVKIFRKDSFIGMAQGKVVPEFLAMSKKSIGSFWDNSNSKTVGSGLNFSEQKILLPTIVDCEPEDRNFRSKVTEYYMQMKTSVPYEKGRELEIGLETDNKLPVSADNQPLNLSDYLTYRHAIAHPEVAASKQDGLNNMLKSYYVFDAQDNEDFELKASLDKDKALELYLSMKKKPEKVDMLLTMLDIDPRTFKGKNAAALKLEKLKSLAETVPDKLVALAEHKLIDDMYTIQQMILTRILNKVGERIVNPETGVTVGHNMAESVAWLKDPLNSQSVAMMKTRMQEGMKAGTAVSKSI